MPDRSRILRSLIVVILLVLALPVGLYLSQHKQIYKSKASSPGDCRCSGRSIICEVDNGDGTTHAEWKGDDPSCTEGTPPSFTKQENPETHEVTTIIESVNVIGNNAGVVAKPPASTAPVPITPPAVSSEANALRDAKTKECSVTLGLCPMIDPTTLVVVGWVPSDKAVFGTFGDAIVARSGLSIGDTTKQIQIDGKTYVITDPNYKLDVKPEEVAGIKKIADQQKVEVDAAGQIIIDPKRYDIDKIQTQVNDYAKQQDEAEKAIADQVLQTGDKTNFQYLSPEMQKQVNDLIKINAATKAALEGNNQAKDKLPEDQQAKVDEAVKNAQDQQAKLENIAKQCATTEETTCDTLTSKLNQNEKEAVKKITDQIIANAKAIETQRLENIDIVAAQLASLKREQDSSGFSDEEYIKRFNEIKSQGVDSEIMKVVAEKAVAINKSLDDYLKCRGTNCVIPESLNDEQKKFYTGQRAYAIAQEAANAYDEAKTLPPDERTSTQARIELENTKNAAAISSYVDYVAYDQLLQKTQILLSDQNTTKILPTDLTSDSNYLHIAEKLAEEANKKIETRVITKLYEEYYSGGCQYTAQTQKLDPNCQAIEIEVNKKADDLKIPSIDLAKIKDNSAVDFATRLAKSTGETAQDVQRSLEAIAKDIQKPQLVENINNRLIADGELSYQQMQEFRKIKDENGWVKFLALADPTGVTINNRIKQNVIISDSVKKQEDLKIIENQVTDRLWALANPLKLFSEDQRQKSAEGAILALNYVSAGSVRNGNDILNHGIKTNDWLEIGRGAIIQGAIPAALTVSAVALPIAGMFAPTSLALVPGQVFTTALGTASSVQSLGHTALACDGKAGSEIRCGLAAANSAFLILSTGLGAAGGDALIFESQAEQALIKSNIVEAEKLVAKAAIRQASLQSANKFNGVLGTLVFGGNATNACYLEKGELTLDLNCGLMTGITLVSAARMFSPMNINLGRADVVLQGSMATQACAALIAGSGDVFSCGQSIGYASLSVGHLSQAQAHTPEGIRTIGESTKAEFLKNPNDSVARKNYLTVLKMEAANLAHMANYDPRSPIDKLLNRPIPLEIEQLQTAQREFLQDTQNKDDLVSTYQKVYAQYGSPNPVRSTLISVRNLIYQDTPAVGPKTTVQLADGTVIFLKDLVGITEIRPLNEGQSSQELNRLAKIGRGLITRLQNGETVLLETTFEITYLDNGVQRSVRVAPENTRHFPIVDAISNLFKTPGQPVRTKASSLAGNLLLLSAPGEPTVTNQTVANAIEQAAPVTTGVSNQELASSPQQSTTERDLQNLFSFSNTIMNPVNALANLLKPQTQPAPVIVAPVTTVTGDSNRTLPLQETETKPTSIVYKSTPSNATVVDSNVRYSIKFDSDLHKELSDIGNQFYSFNSSGYAPGSEAEWRNDLRLKAQELGISVSELESLATAIMQDVEKQTASHNSGLVAVSSNIDIEATLQNMRNKAQPAQTIASETTPQSETNNQRFVVRGFGLYELGSDNLYHAMGPSTEGSRKVETQLNRDRIARNNQPLAQLPIIQQPASIPQTSLINTAINFAKALAIGGINPYQMYQNLRTTQTQSVPVTTVTGNRTLPLQETGVVNEIKTYLATGQNSWTVAGNNLLKQLENSTQFLGEKLSDGLSVIGNLITQKPTTLPTQSAPTNFVEYFLNGKKYTDPSLPQQLLSDHFSIKQKYGLPKRDIRFENPGEYIEQLKEIARKNGVPIRDKSEFQQFFDENPIAGAVYDDKGRQIFVDLSKDPIALAGDLEHELTHALQHIKYPDLPIELQEYEAYVGANMRIGEDFLNDPENIANVFGAIGSSVKNWYENEKLPVPWGTTQQSPAQPTTTVTGVRALALQNAVRNIATNAIPFANALVEYLDSEPMESTISIPVTDIANAWNRFWAQQKTTLSDGSLTDLRTNVATSRLSEPNIPEDEGGAKSVVYATPLSSIANTWNHAVAQVRGWIAKRPVVVPAQTDTVPVVQQTMQNVEEEQIKQLEKEYADIQSSTNDLERKISDLEVLILRYQGQVKDTDTADTQSKNLKQEIDLLTQEGAILEQQKSQLEENIHASNRNINQLKVDLPKDSNITPETQASAANETLSMIVSSIDDKIIKALNNAAQELNQSENVLSEAAQTRINSIIDSINTLNMDAIVRKELTKKLVFSNDQEGTDNYTRNIVNTLNSNFFRRRYLSQNRVRIGMIIDTKTEKNIVAVGDVHGDWNALVRMLSGQTTDERGNRVKPVLDKKGNWIGGPNDMLILTGDLVDRAPEGVLSVQTAEKIMKLQKQAGNLPDGTPKIKVLLGNHDANAIYSYWQMVGMIKSSGNKMSVKDIASVIANGSQAIRPGITSEDLLYLYNHREIAEWMMTWDAMIIIDGTLYQHSDITEYLSYGNTVLTINESIKAILRNEQGIKTLKNLAGTLTDRDQLYPDAVTEYIKALGVGAIVHGHSEGGVPNDSRVTNIDGGLSEHYAKRAKTGQNRGRFHNQHVEGKKKVQVTLTLNSLPQLPLLTAAPLSNSLSNRQSQISNTTNQINQQIQTQRSSINLNNVQVQNIDTRLLEIGSELDQKQEQFNKLEQKVSQKEQINLRLEETNKILLETREQLTQKQIFLRDAKKLIEIQNQIYQEINQLRASGLNIPSIILNKNILKDTNELAKTIGQIIETAFKNKLREDQNLISVRTILSNIHPSVKLLEITYDGVSIINRINSLLNEASQPPDLPITEDVKVEDQPAPAPQAQETGTVTGVILNQWGIDLNTVSEPVRNIITDNIFDPGFAGRLASQENKTAEDGAPIPVVRSSVLPALISAGARVIATIDLPDVRAQNDISYLNGNYYFREKIKSALGLLPGSIAVRIDGDKFVFVNFENIPNTLTEPQFHILANDSVRTFSTQNIDISNFFVHHPEFTNSLDPNLQKFLTVAFEDKVLNNPKAFKDYKHMLLHLQATGQTEFTAIKIDTPVYTKTKNDIENEAAGDETIRQLAALVPGATIFRDGAVIYFVVPKGTNLAPIQNSTYTVTYPNRETFTYPLNLFTSSSEFTLSAESFNLARSTTSNDIQSQIDAYVKSLSPDDPWLRNIYFNPLTSRGLANLRAVGKTETEIEELKTHYRSAGKNIENGKEAWIWDDKPQLLNSASTFPPILLLPAGPLGQLVLPFIAQSLLSQTPTAEQTPSTGPPAAQNPNQLAFDFTPPLILLPERAASVIVREMEAAVIKALMGPIAGNYIAGQFSPLSAKPTGVQIAGLLPSPKVQPSLQQSTGNEEEMSKVLDQIYTEFRQLINDKDIINIFILHADIRNYQSMSSGDNSLITIRHLLKEKLNSKPQFMNLINQLAKSDNITIDEELGDVVDLLLEENWSLLYTVSHLLNDVHVNAKLISPTDPIINKIKGVIPKDWKDILPIAQIKIGNQGNVYFFWREDVTDFRQGIFVAKVPIVEQSDQSMYVVDSKEIDLLNKVMRVGNYSLTSEETYFPKVFSSQDPEITLMEYVDITKPRIIAEQKESYEIGTKLINFKPILQVVHRNFLLVQSGYINDDPQNENYVVDNKLITLDVGRIKSTHQIAQQSSQKELRVIQDHILNMEAEIIAPLLARYGVDSVYGKTFDPTDADLRQRLKNLITSDPFNSLPDEVKFLFVENVGLVTTPNIYSTEWYKDTLLDIFKMTIETSAPAFTTDGLPKSLIEIYKDRQNKLLNRQNKWLTVKDSVYSKLGISDSNNTPSVPPAPQPNARITDQNTGIGLPNPDAFIDVVDTPLRILNQFDLASPIMDSLRSQVVGVENDMAAEIYADQILTHSEALYILHSAQIEYDKLYQENLKFRTEIEKARQDHPDDALAIKNQIKEALNIDDQRYVTLLIGNSTTENIRKSIYSAITYLTGKTTDEIAQGKYQIGVAPEWNQSEIDSRVALLDGRTDIKSIDSAEAIREMNAQTREGLNKFKPDDANDDSTPQSPTKPTANDPEIKTDISKFSDQIDQIVTNVRNRLNALEIRKTIASVLYPEIAKTLADQRNIETINTLSLDPELMRNINSDEILKIVDGDIRLAAVIENNLRTLQPLWNLMQKAGISASFPLNTWLETATNYNNFKFVYDGQFKLDSMRRSALFDVRQDILSSVNDPALENIITNEVIDEFIAKQVNAARQQILGIRQNMDTKEVTNILTTLRADPILGIQMTEKAVADQAVKNATKAAQDAAQAEVSTKKSQPKVAKTASLTQKLLDLISSPAMRRKALIAIIALGIGSVPVVAHMRNVQLNSQGVTSPTGVSASEYGVKTSEVENLPLVNVTTVEGYTTQTLRTSPESEILPITAEQEQVCLTQTSVNGMSYIVYTPPEKLDSATIEFCQKRFPRFVILTNKQLLNLVTVFSNTPDEPEIVPYKELQPKRLTDEPKISIKGVDPDLLNQYVFIRQLGPTCSLTNLASIVNTLRNRQGLASIHPWILADYLEKDGKMGYDSNSGFIALNEYVLDNRFLIDHFGISFKQVPLLSVMNNGVVDSQSEQRAIVDIILERVLQREGIVTDKTERATIMAEVKNPNGPDGTSQTLTDILDSRVTNGKPHVIIQYLTRLTVKSFSTAGNAITQDDRTNAAFVAYINGALQSKKLVNLNFYSDLTGVGHAVNIVGTRFENGQQYLIATEASGKYADTYLAQIAGIKSIGDNLIKIPLTPLTYAMMQTIFEYAQTSQSDDVYVKNTERVTTYTIKVTDAAGLSRFGTIDELNTSLSKDTNPIIAYESHIIQKINNHWVVKFADDIVQKIVPPPSVAEKELHIDSKNGKLLAPGFAWDPRADNRQGKWITVSNNQVANTPSVTPIHQTITLETRPLINGKYQSQTDTVWKIQNRKNLFLNREWLPLEAPVSESTSGPERLMNIIRYFNVDDPENLRYKADGVWTYCNIFVSDVTRALGVEIPRWINGQKTTTDTMEQWLEGKMLGVTQSSQGPASGWKSVTSQEAQKMADEGKPVVAIWNKTDWIGHVSVVIPGQGVTVSGTFYPNTAQAGGKNFVGKPANEGFYGDSQIKYFANTLPNGYAFVPNANIAANPSGGLLASTLP